ncbi:MAG: ABC transporter ATP-binding protein [Burkholderiales bacterium]|nr:ABC transporter ATP-binding protein [Burkholderiales bacterium]
MATASNGPALLEARTLTSGYGRVQIVHRISLSVREGEVLAVIGRNGVGKTTLIKALMGILPAADGAVLFEGEDITHESPHARARRGLGYVPQGRGIFSSLTVTENLFMGERIGEAPVTPASYERIYGFFPILKERGQQMAGSFSGGQQQQLALGRALLGRPRVLLLDEPSEGIQPNIVQDMGALLRRLCKEERLTVIVVEQNLDLIRAMADRCIVVDKGAVVAELQPSALADPAVAARYLAV